MTGYSEGKHNDPADTQDRLVRIGAKYQATAPTVADGDNVYVLVDSAGRVIVTGEVAHDAVDLGNPLKIGGKANTGAPAAVASGDRVNGNFDEFGDLRIVVVDPATGAEFATGSLPIQGQAADGAAVAGNPLRISGKDAGGLTQDLETDGPTGGQSSGPRLNVNALLSTHGRGTSNDGLSNTDTVTTTKGYGDTGAGILAVGALGYGLAPDGAWDRLRTVGDAAPGLGVLAVGNMSPGASEVKSTNVVMGATSTTRATILTPTAGKKVRIISVNIAAHALTTDPGRISVYFGAGASYTTDITLGIGEVILHKKDTTYGGSEQIGPFPDGGGPVGAADAVVSWITEIETETALRVTIVYREE